MSSYTEQEANSNSTSNSSTGTASDTALKTIQISVAEREYRDLELARRFGKLSVRVYSDSNQYAALQTFDYQEKIDLVNKVMEKEDENAIHGIIDTDLLEIVRDRLKSFQNGNFATAYNEKALEHIEIALMYMNQRVEDRIERNVLGTYNA